MLVYVIKNKNNEYYIGHCGRFNKDISKARLFKSPKTAIRHYWSKDNYENLEVVSVDISIKGMPLPITDELYKEYNNLDYKVYQQNKVV